MALVLPQQPDQVEEALARVIDIGLVEESGQTYVTAGVDQALDLVIQIFAQEEQAEEEVFRQGQDLRYKDWYVNLPEEMKVIMRGERRKARLKSSIQNREEVQANTRVRRQEQRRKRADASNVRFDLAPFIDPKFQALFLGPLLLTQMDGHRLTPGVLGTVPPASCYPWKTSQCLTGNCGARLCLLCYEGYSRLEPKMSRTGD